MNAVIEEAMYWIVQDIESMLAIKNANGTEEEKADVMRLAAEAMVFKLEDSGIIPTLEGTEKETFLHFVCLTMQALNGGPK